MSNAARLVAVAIMAAAIALPISETWSKGEQHAHQSLDTHRVGVVEQVRSNDRPASNGQRLHQNWATVALGNYGYGYVGHINALVPVALAVHSGDQVEIAFGDTPGAGPDRVVRVVRH